MEALNADTKYYISFDGGDTKLLGLLFDSCGNILGKTKAGGVNTTVHSEDTVNARIDGCVKDLLSQGAEKGVRINEIQMVTASRAGDSYFKSVNRFVPCREHFHTSEGLLGVLTSGRTSALCTLSGTGSDVFYIKDCEEIDVIGGWGYYLGDEGSGTWIGRKAIRSLMRALSGLAPFTTMHNLIMEESGARTENDVLELIYGQPSIAYYTGTFCKTVEKAAKQGDKEALEILRSAGRELAAQTVDMMKKHDLPGNMKLCVTGSVFTFCDIMRESFLENVKKTYPEIDFAPPEYLPVVGGVIYCLLKEKSGNAGNDNDISEIMSMIEPTCREYKI